MRPVGRIARQLTATVAIAVTLFLGAVATALASSAPAHADIFGVSDAVEDWLCGIVAPDEPWEGVGSGPEALISNRNLAGARPTATTAVTSDGQLVSTAPVNPDVVPDTMDELPALPEGMYTLYETAGLRGLTWVTIPVTPDGSARACNLWNYLFTQAGNAVFTVNKLLLQVVISVKEAATAEDPLSFLYDEASGAVGTTFAVFAIPIASVAMLITGIWLGIRSVTSQGRPREAVAAVVGGLFIAFIGGFLYLSNNSGATGFRMITATVDQAINQASAVASNALFDGAIDGDQSCALPTDDTSVLRGQRVTSCVLADALAYRPWAVGQFGAAGAAPIPVPEGWTVVNPAANGAIEVTELGEQTLPCYVDFDDCQDLRTYLIAQHGGVQVGDRPAGATGYAACAHTAVAAAVAQLSLVTADENTVSLLSGTPCSPMYRTFQALAATDQRMAASYSGAGAITRVTQAITAAVGTIVTGVAVLMLGLITMVWIASVLVLWIIGAFKLPVAVYRNKIRMATEWAADLVHAWICRLAYGILLSIVILIISWMMNSALSFGFKLLWLGILLWGVWKMIGKVQALLRPGGASSANSSLSTDSQAALTKTARTGMGASRRTVSGGSAGASAAWESRRQLMTDSTRSRGRRTVTAVMAPLTVAAGAGRGIVAGPTRTNARRAHRSMRDIAAQSRQKPTTPPDATPSTPMSFEPLIPPAPLAPPPPQSPPVNLTKPPKPTEPPTPPVPPPPSPAPEPPKPPAPRAPAAPPTPAPPPPTTGMPAAGHPDRKPPPPPARPTPPAPSPPRTPPRDPAAAPAEEAPAPRDPKMVGIR